MTIELDHFFILTEPGSPQADLVSRIGLIEGAPNSHPGQGTANRRFFFSNSTLEFLYIRDTEEAEKGRASRLRFNERVSNANASPFGLIVRTLGDPTDVPFPGWKYCPEYFKEDQCFHVGESSDLLEEPLCICKPSNLPQRKSVPQPDNQLWTMTKLRINVPVVRPSATLQAVAKCKDVILRLGKPHCLELVFNDEKEGSLKDMTPDLPLIVRW